jgi:hypothetical protein
MVSARPLMGRYRRDEVERWLPDAGLGVVAILPGLGWRAIVGKPLAEVRDGLPCARLAAPLSRSSPVRPSAVLSSVTLTPWD